jgi:hypothetical protein
MEILFEVDGELCSLPEGEATVLAENLRLRTVGDDDVYGMEGAELVSDLIENTLVEARSGPIPLEGDAAEAVYYVLDSSTSNLEGASYRLYLAVRALHRALEEL